MGRGGDVDPGPGSLHVGADPSVLVHECWSTSASPGARGALSAYFRKFYRERRIFWPHTP